MHSPHVTLTKKEKLAHKGLSEQYDILCIYFENVFYCRKTPKADKMTIIKLEYPKLITAVTGKRVVLKDYALHSSWTVIFFFVTHKNAKHYFVTEHPKNWYPVSHSDSHSGT